MFEPLVLCGKRVGGTPDPQSPPISQVAPLLCAKVALRHAEANKCKSQWHQNLKKKRKYEDVEPGSDLELRDLLLRELKDGEAARLLESKKEEETRAKTQRFGPGDKPPVAQHKLLEKDNSSLPRRTAFLAQAHVVLASLIDVPLRSEVFVKMQWHHFTLLPNKRWRLAMIKDRTKTRMPISSIYVLFSHSLSLSGKPLVCNLPEFLSEVYSWWKAVGWPALRGSVLRHEYLFCQQDGTGPRSEIRSLVNKLMKKYIGTYSTVHSFRHQQVTESLEIGASPLETAAMCAIRQHSESTAARYYQRSSRDRFANIAEAHINRLKERREQLMNGGAASPPAQQQEPPLAVSAPAFCSACGTKLSGLFCSSCGHRSATNI